MQASDAMADEELRGLVTRAVAGDGASMASLCEHLQHLVYRLALRFFSSHEDAQDATQDIMVLVIRQLHTYEGRAKVTTWVYAVASRHLLRAKARATEDSVQGPRAFAAWLDRHGGDAPTNVADVVEFQVLESEVRIACTLGMLLCLSREVRLAYILGDVVGLTATEGAEVLALAPAAFRKRLERARTTMRSILSGRCGLLDANNPCACSRQITPSVEYGLVSRDFTQWTSPTGTHSCSSASARRSVIPVQVVRAAAAQLEEVEAMASLYRAAPEYRAPAAVMKFLEDECEELVQR